MTALYAIGDFVGTVERPAMAAPLPKLWYLLRLHPNFDLKAERQLLERGISAYVPKEKQTKRCSWNRKVVRDVPIFPGSMFVPDCHADIAMLKRNADGIGGFVKYCGEAVKVSLRTMAEVRRFEAKRNGLPEQRKFRVDQNVRVVGGPFDLLEGRIERLDSRFRVSVLIEILGACSSVQLDENHIEAV